VIWPQVWQRDITDVECSTNGYTGRPYQWSGETCSKQDSQLDHRFQDDVQKRRVVFDDFIYEEDENRAITSLINDMLAFDPKKRWNFKQVLASE
jgi:hypothetical protein